MMRIFMLIAATLLLTSSQASAQYVRGQIGPGNTFIYPAGTTAYYYGLNGYRSGYYYMPPVNSGNYGPMSYGGIPLYGNRGNQGYYVPPNSSGGGGYYSNTPAYNGGNYYGR